MKNIFNIIAVLGATIVVSAQTNVSIDMASSGNSNIIMEFNDKRPANTTGENKSLILPVAENINVNSVPGTIWLDAKDNTIKLINNTGAINLTLPGTDVKAPSANETQTEQGVIIGDDSSNAKGVLVLESTTQAMVLPHVDSVADVISPEPGSMVYDKSEKGIALFNGDRWTFWVE